MYRLIIIVFSLCVNISIYGQYEGRIFNKLNNCILKTKEDNLIVRTEADNKSKAIKILQSGSSLLWLNYRSDKKEEVRRNGKLISDYWYKVAFDIDDQTYSYKKDSIGWVFGRDLELAQMNMEFIVDSNLISLNNDWLKAEYVNAKLFNKLSLVPVKWIPNTNSYRKNGPGKRHHDKFILNFLNGKSKTYEIYADDEDEGVDLLGEFPELGYYIIAFEGADCSYATAVRKSDGKEISDIEFPVFSFLPGSSSKQMPILAQDHKTFLCKNDCESGGFHDMIWVEYTKENILPKLRFHNVLLVDFRFENSRSGIVKTRLRSSNNSERLIYLRLTLK